MNGMQNRPENASARQAPAESAPMPPAAQGPSGPSAAGGQPAAAGQAAYPPPQGYGPAVAPAASARDPRAKSPALASVLSLVPGLGQVYLGHYQRGFIHAIVVAGIISLLVAADGPPIPFFTLFLIFFWLYNIIDAGRRATYYNQVLAGGDVPEVSDDFKMPGIRGSLLGGLALIVGGAVLLSNTLFDVSLEWVEDWWPVLPIALGVYLLFKYAQERIAESESK